MRTLTRTLVVGLLAAAAAPWGAPAHAAVPTTVSAKIVDTECRDLPWRGTVTHKLSNGSTIYNNTKPVGASGTVKTCVYVYKVADTSKKFDWYMTAVSSDWKRKSWGTEHLVGKKEPWSVRIAHSKPAQSKDYKATGTYKKPTFKSSFDVGISWGVGSISVPVNLSSSVTVKRDYLTDTSAKWSCSQATSLKTTSMVYGSKVKQGKKRPTFSVDFSYPHYTYTYKRITASAPRGGGSYKAWKISGTTSTTRTALFRI